MLCVYEVSIRDGILRLIKYYAGANNKCMFACNEEKDITYIRNASIKNLYGWALSKLLTYGWFKWVEDLPIFVYLNSSESNHYKNRTLGHTSVIDFDYLFSL